MPFWRDKNAGKKNMWWEILKYEQAFKDGKWWERKVYSGKDSMKKNSDT